MFSGTGYAGRSLTGRVTEEFICSFYCAPVEGNSMQQRMRRKTKSAGAKALLKTLALCVRLKPHAPSGKAKMGFFIRESAIRMAPYMRLTYHALSA